MKVKTTVVNLKTDEYDVYIGRGSKWGNPFRIGTDNTREEVVRKYREWVLDNDYLMESLHELVGKRLGCYCKPLLCHGDILVEFANGLEESVFDPTPINFNNYPPGTEDEMRRECDISFKKMNPHIFKPDKGDEITSKYYRTGKLCRECYLKNKSFFDVMIGCGRSFAWGKCVVCGKDTNVWKS